MARKREGSINESLDELLALESQYAGRPELSRIIALRILKGEPHLGIEDVAHRVGYSTPTVKRWWRAYREGGLDSYLNISASGRPVEQQDEMLVLLREKLLRGEFSSIQEVRALLNDSANHPPFEGNAENSSGFEFSTPGTVSNESSSVVSKVSGYTGRVDVVKLIEFLDALSLGVSIEEWSGKFRTALCQFLGDVDRVSMTLNVLAQLHGRDDDALARPQISIVQSLVSGKKTVDPMPTAGDGISDDEHVSRLLAALRRRKFPFSQYHSPHAFVYHHDGVYIAMIVLWREKHRPPVSKHSLEIMELLQSFWVMVLSQFIARHQTARPIERVFNSAFNALTLDHGLTTQEHRTLILLLLGMSYEEAAETLNVSINTVRYHLKSIYAKTGAHSQADLFAKYFTPRFDPSHGGAHKDH